MHQTLPLRFTLLTLLGLAVYGCDESKNFDGDMLTPLAGGAGTVSVQTQDSFSLPNKNITPKHRVDFVVGNALFKENWVPSPSSVVSRQGLGPLINAQSCSTCHFKDGRGAPPTASDEIPVGLLVRMSLPGKDPHTGAVIAVPDYGDQLQHKAILGVRAEASVLVDYEDVLGHYDDGTPYMLINPKLRFAKQKFGAWPKETLFSARVAPHLIGLGLLEAIPESEILAREDPDDLNKDGISGRANFVWNQRLSNKTMGRFGWKANQPSLEQQNAAAFAGDMGVTSSMFLKKNCTSKDGECNKAYATHGPEISDENLARLTAYTKTLAVPARRNLDDKSVLSGAGIFHQIGCAKCHVAAHTTGVDAEFPENSKQVIFPYTDLLLHDMGEGLADNRPDFEASGTEWRTPPLWGIGLTHAVNNHTRFLHDGRARSIEEAILWHGGEAETAQSKFRGLKPLQRKQLIKFLESI